jgi:hypothetical protein
MWWRVGAVALVLVVGVALWREQTPDPGPRLDLGDTEPWEPAPPYHGGRPWAPADLSSEEVVFRYTLTDPYGSDVRIVTLDHERRVVTAPGSCTLAAGDLRTLVLSGSGADRLADVVVEAIEAVPADRRSPSGRAPGARATVVLGSGELASFPLRDPPVPTPPPEGAAAVLADLPDVLADLGWLADEVIEPDTSWVPPELELLLWRVDPGDVPDVRDPVVPWPDDVEEPTVPDEDQDGRATVRGTGVAPVLALFETDPHPVVRIGGAVASLTLGVSLPGGDDVDGC